MYTDIKEYLEDDVTLAPLIGTRVYQGKPIQETNSTYITMIIQDRQPSDVWQRNRVRLTIFSRSMDTRVDIAERVIDIFHGKSTINMNASLFKSRVLGATDGTERLQNGLYYSMVDIELYAVR